MVCCVGTQITSEWSNYFTGNATYIPISTIALSAPKPYLITSFDWSGILSSELIFSSVPSQRKPCDSFSVRRTYVSMCCNCCSSPYYKYCMRQFCLCATESSNKVCCHTFSTSVLVVAAISAVLFLSGL